MRRGSILGAIITAAVIGGIVTVASGSANYSSHAAIYIEGDSQFIAANGVIRGSGTLEDPYIIQGWEISYSYPALLIRGTTKHVVIQECSVNDSGDGIRIENARNVIVQDCVFVGNDDAIVFEGVVDAAVLRCEIVGDTGAGVGLFSCTNIALDLNSIRSSKIGIEVIDCFSGITVCNNTVAAIVRTGIELGEGSTENLVAHNHVSTSRVGIHVCDTENEIFGNWSCGGAAEINQRGED